MVLSHGILMLALAASAGEGSALPGTVELAMDGDLAVQMVAGIDAFVTREIAASVEKRARFWNRDFASHEAYSDSVSVNRDRLRRIIGAVDDRLAPRMESTAASGESDVVAQAPGYQVRAVRWQVLDGVCAEGLVLEPERPVANVVVVPDCDRTPEMAAGLASGLPESAQVAKRLAENGCRVVVPVLIDRRDTYSGHPDVRMTNQPHREFIYRAAHQLGRHIIGYEVQKVLAAVDWFAMQDDLPVGLFGYGEGGLVALYASAIDTRVDVTVVSGYFGPREGLWAEPIYRNVWALLDEFGDAELATLVLPRPLIIEASPHPEVSGPPRVSRGRSGAAPGIIETPRSEAVRAEVDRANALIKKLDPPARAVLIEADASGSDPALAALLEALGRDGLAPPGPKPSTTGGLPDADTRMKRQFDELVEHTQMAMRNSPKRRAEFWSKADDSSVEAWRMSTKWYRDYLWDEVIGRFPPADVPVNPRTRQVYDESAYRGYEVMIDVYPEVFAYGILLVPKDLAPDERRPVVVCQHGLEGRPQDAADPNVENKYYNQFGCQLAERGYVVFAPQNPYIGGDAFRVIQRKANPLRRSLFAVIVRQHERILEWLGSQSFVDADRMAFYGLSYGGKTAMRVPALLEGYGLSICSADYNEWIWKTASARSPYSYLFTGEYEMFEFDLGNTFNYAELSGLICPRPFMVERGHHDGVAPDEWVGYEYARTQRRYDLLGIGDRTAIEFFDGPHTIHGVGTFEFLERHLGFPEAGER